MRTSEPKDRKRSGAGDRRRAGGYLVQLSWLEGFPDAGGWRAIEGDRLITLEGGAVAKARRIARTVMREHPQALPKLVGDVERWWAIVDAKLRWCSAAIAGTAEALDVLPLLPVRLTQAVRELAGTTAGEAARVAAIAWVAEPDVLDEIVGWLAAHRQALRVVEEPVGELPPWRVMLALARLAVIGASGKPRAVRERGVDALLALCAVDAPDPFPALDVTRNVESRLRRQNATEAPVPNRSRPRVVPWIVSVATCDDDARQRILAGASEAQIAEALLPWEAWERQHAGLMARANELAAVEFDAKDKAVHDVRVIQKLEKARAQAPVPVSVADALDELRMLGHPALAPRTGSIVRLLAALPAALGPAARARMLVHAVRIAATSEVHEHVEWVWDALAEALDDSAPLELLAPWKRALTTEGRMYVEQDLAEDLKRADVQRLVRVLIDLAWRGQVAREDPGRARAWLAAGSTDEILVADLVAALRDVEGYLLVEVARGALAIAERTVADVVAIAKPLLELTKSSRHYSVRQLSVLFEHAANTGGGWIMRAALEAKQGEALTTIADTMKLLPKSKWPPLTRETKASWIERYPVALAPALRRLASVDPDAERSAAKRLATDLPEPEALEREIAALRTRLGNAGAAKRLANLEARLAKPTLPSPARLTKLAAKLERAAREIGLQRFTSEITRGASARVMKAFGMTQLPEWAMAPKTIALLFALLDLEDADREIAGRLVRARSGPPPWDLRDEQPNREFLAQMRQANVDPVPWLDDTPRTITPRDGEPFTLAMTSDPIEVFAMGAHFETCL
ncbi:MAG: hypothetical protein H0V17_13485, partial [Deltaproteobacteria bacterium]|nr:hypothetical protein [Deltaproteobacteria bacterium]